MNFSKRTKALTVSMLLEGRRRRKKAQQRSALAHAKNLFLAFGSLMTVLLMAAALYGAYTITSLMHDLPSLDEITLLLDPDSGLFLKPTQFLDREGQVVLYTLENAGVERRYLGIDPTQPGHFSPRLVQAIVAYLEPNYWSGPGFSWKKSYEDEPQTIAEELVRATLLEEAEEKDALRMRLLAAQVTAAFGRVQVLEWYLNSAYFGRMSFGADQAAQLYFGKSAEELNLAESSLLISLLKTPALNPIDAPQAALERKNEILLELAASDLFSPDDIQQALAEEVTFAPWTGPSADENEFAAYVMNQLGAEMDLLSIQRGGFRVITSIDAGLQQQLICTAQIQIKRLAGDPNAGLSDRSECTAALLLPALKPGKSPLEDLRANGLVLDPQTGEILAWSGLQDADGPVMASADYQPGSLLTPFVASAAFARGLSPASLLWDAPKSTDNPDQAATASPDGLYHGPQRLRYAVANDYLTAIAQLFQQVGAENISLLVQTLGLDDLDTFDLSTLAGGGSVDLVDIAHAYSTFANLGEQRGWPSATGSLQPVSVLSVETYAGQVVFKRTQPASQPVLSPGLAYLVHDVLSDSVARQPSLGFPNALDIGRTAGAKIGQISSSQQVWTVGYTQKHLAVIWLGIAQDESEQQDEGLQPEMAAGIWHAIMQHSTKEEPIQDWRKPPDVVTRTVCSPSGQLPTADCPLKVEEIFLAGSEPFSADSLFRTYAINMQTGRLATVFTPLELVVEETFLVPPAPYLDWAVSSGLKLPPTDYDLIQAPDPIPGVEITSPAPFSHVRGTITIKGWAAGDQFESYRLQIGEGLNPRNWLQIGDPSTRRVMQGTLGTWDTEGLNGLYVIRLIVLRDNNQLDTHVVQVSVDNTTPMATVTYPQQGETIAFEFGKDLVLLAAASDPIGIDHLDWYVDGKMIGQSENAPYYLSWRMAKGEHSLYVEAYDLAGNAASSKEISFSIE